MEPKVSVFPLTAGPPSPPSLLQTIYPALAAQQLELERERLQAEALELRAQERARFAVHQAIADTFRPRARVSSAGRLG